MSWGIIAGSVIGALGSVGGAFISADQAPDPIDPGDALRDILEVGFEATGNLEEILPPATFVNPLADPVSNLFATDLLLQIGRLPGNLSQLGSPLSQAISFAGAVPQIVDTDGEPQTTVDDVAAVLQRAARPGVGRDSIKGKFSKESVEAAEAAVRRLGFRNFGEFQAAQLKFQEDAQAFQSSAQQIVEDVREGRMSALQAVSQLQQDFPVATQSAIDTLRNTVRQNLEARIERDRGREEASILEAANVGGFSPSAGLGLLAEATNLRREEADIASLTEAIQLLGGQQQLGAQALGALQGSLLAPAGALSNLSAQRTNALSNLAQIAASQANAIRNNVISTLLGQNQTGGALAGLAASQGAAAGASLGQGISAAGQQLAAIPGQIQQQQFQNQILGLLEQQNIAQLNQAKPGVGAQIDADLVSAFASNPNIF